MLRITLAGLRAHKLRLLLSGLAIILGVGFVAGTLTFSDTVKTELFHQFARSARHVDVAVQPPKAPTGTRGQGAPTLPDSLLTMVSDVPGVSSAEGRMAGPATLLSEAGRPVTDGGSGGLAMDVPGDPRFQSFTVKTGRLPRRPDEALLDAETAAIQHFTLGETLTVLDADGVQHQVRLVGTVDLGVSKGVNGQSVLEMLPAGLHRLGIHGYQRIDLAAAPGIGQARLASRVSSAVGSVYKVETGTTLAHDLADSVLHSLDMITTGILVFAVVAVFVSAIVVFNTFNILVAQRLRELALLRCVGATAGQVFRSVVVESLIIGLIASAIGVLAGLGITLVMMVLSDPAGTGASSGGLVVTAAPVIVGLSVGTVVTVISAIWPAARATRVAPIAALRAPAGNPAGRARHALTFSGLAIMLCAIGVAFAAAGLNKGRTGLFFDVGGGAVFFIGVLFAGPLLVGPLARFLGWAPGKLFGAPARLATANARRNPGRSAATMIALTIGVGLITLFSVVTSTARSYAFAQVDQHYPADYIVAPLRTQSATQQLTIPPHIAASLRAAPQIAVAAELRRGNATTPEGDLGIAAVDPTAYRAAWKPLMSTGSADPLATGTGAIAILDKTARSLRVRVGDRLQVRMTNGTRSMRVAGTFTSQFGGETAVISWRDFMAGFGAGGDNDILVKLKTGVSLTAGWAAVNKATIEDPLVTVTSITAYKSQITSAINRILAMFGGLLAIAILIALFGIANTLSLSVIERTREFGLLRAIGLTKSQLRRTLSTEALLLAVMGAITGVVVGAGFGWVVAKTFIRGSGGHSSVSYPISQILAYVLIAALAGLAAGVLPTRKAAKISVIEAISET